MNKQTINNKIIIFGASENAKDCIMTFREIGIEIHAVTDNNIKRIGEVFLDHSIRDVQSVFEEVRQDPSNYTFIVCSIHWDAINRQINEQNLREQCCIYSLNDTNEFFFEHHKNLKKQYYNINYQNDFEVWTKNLLSEVKFWYEEVKKDNKFLDNLWGFYKNFYYKYLNKKINKNDTVLDVGCGVVSYLGSRFENNGTINLIPIDPLASYYKAVVDKFTDNPQKEKMYVKFGMFEYLSYYFGENFADAIIVSNALDHCIDPIKGILETIKTLKKDTGELVLFHFIEEGKKAFYSGLHKWNLDLIDGDFVIWNNRNYININKLLDGYVEMTVKLVDSKDASGPRKSVLVNIKKIKDIEPDKLLGINDLERMAFSLQEMLIMQQNLDYCNKYISLMNS